MYENSSFSSFLPAFGGFFKQNFIVVSFLWCCVEHFFIYVLSIRYPLCDVPAAVLCLSLSCVWPTPWTWPSRLLCPWDSPGRNTGVACHALFQGIFPSQGSNPGLPRCRQILYWLSHQGSPRILEWVVYPFLQGIFLTQESNWGL